MSNPEQSSLCSADLSLWDIGWVLGCFCRGGTFTDCAPPRKGGQGQEPDVCQEGLLLITCGSPYGICFQATGLALSPPQESFTKTRSTDRLSRRWGPQYAAPSEERPPHVGPLRLDKRGTTMNFAFCCSAWTFFAPLLKPVPLWFRPQLTVSRKQT